MARMIAKVTGQEGNAEHAEPQRKPRKFCARSASLCVLSARAALFCSSRSTRVPGAHDLERTQVLLTFARDGSFVLDVANDPSWLKLRLESFPGQFADRVVLWVDGHEVRPTSVGVSAAGRNDGAAPLGVIGCAAVCRRTRTRCAGTTGW